MYGVINMQMPIQVKTHQKESSMQRLAIHLERCSWISRSFSSSDPPHSPITAALPVVRSSQANCESHTSVSRSGKAGSEKYYCLS